MATVPQSNLRAVNNLGQNTPSSPAQVGLVVGPTVSGTANQIILDDSITTVIQNFDSGPGSEEAATALVEPGAGTVYQIKTPTSVAGTVSSVTKTAGATAGPVVDDFGSYLSAGADFNGDVLFTGKQEGAELEIVAGGAEAISVVGLHVLITIKLATTTGTSLAALVSGSAPALALWSATAIGTGASLNSTVTGGTFAETSGRIGFQALTTGMQLRTIIPAASQPRIVALTGGTIVDIQLATNSHAEPLASETAINIQSDLVTLANNNPGKFRSTLAGSGSALLGAKALTSLTFGSTGTMTVSGSPNDAYQVSVQITQAGGLGTAAFSVSLGNSQGLPLYSGTFLVPPGGTFVIPDTGLTLTFSGTFDQFDTFTFTTTAPLSTLSDVVTALTYFISRPEQASLIQVAGEIPVVNIPAWVAALQSIGNQLEAAHKYARILLEYAGPSAMQTNAAWATQVSGILATLAAPRILVFGGSCNAEAALPLPQAGRFEVVNGCRFVFARALALPSGVDVADQTLSGPATSVLEAYQTDAATALAGARSAYFFLLSGVPGVQMDGVLLDAPTGDYTRLVIGRVIDEVSFYASLRQAKYVATAQQRNADGTLKLTSRIAIKRDLENYLTQLIVKPGNAEAIQVSVDGSNTDGRLIITYYVQIKFYVYTIDGRVGAVKTLRVTI